MLKAEELRLKCLELSLSMIHILYSGLDKPTTRDIVELAKTIENYVKNGK